MERGDVSDTAQSAVAQPAATTDGPMAAGAL